MAARVPEYRVVVVGKTGSGKSTVCNKLYNGTPDGPFHAHKGMSAIQDNTFVCNVSSRHGCRIHIVDVPDFFEDYTPEEATTKFSGWTNAAPYDVPTAFLLVISPHRFTPSVEQRYRHYMQALPQGVEDHLILAFTHIEGFEKKIDEEVSEIAYLKLLLEKSAGRFLTFAKPDKEGQLEENIVKLYSSLGNMKHVQAAARAPVATSNTISASEVTSRRQQQLGPSTSTVTASPHKTPSSLSECRVLVIGKVGSGRSTLCNKLHTGTTSGPFTVYNRMGMMTTSFQCETKRTKDGLFYIVDSPDVFETCSKEAALAEFSKWESYGPPHAPTVILITMRLDIFLEDIDIDFYKKYLQIVPLKYKKVLMFAFTHTEDLNVDHEVNESAAAELVQLVGGRYVAFSKNDGPTEIEKSLKIIKSIAEHCRIDENTANAKTDTKSVGSMHYRRDGGQQSQAQRAQESQAQRAQSQPVAGPFEGQASRTSAPTSVTPGNMGSRAGATANVRPVHYPELPPEKYRVVVVGKKQSGKTTVCNRLMGTPFFDVSRTLKAACGFQKWQHIMLCIVDTPDVYNIPGINTRSREQVVVKFTEWEQLTEADVPIAFVFTVRADVAFTMDDKILYDQYLGLLPKKYQENVILAYTHSNTRHPDHSNMHSLQAKAKGRIMNFPKDDGTRPIEEYIDVITATLRGTVEDNPMNKTCGLM